MPNTVFWTIFSGASVYIFGQTVHRYILDPLLDFKKARAAIVRHVITNASILTLEKPQNERAFEALKETRKSLATKSIELGGDLISTARAVPFYPLFSFIFRYPSLRETLKATSDLVDLSNNVSNHSSVSHYLEENRVKAFDSLAKMLRFKFTYSDLQLISTGYFMNGKSLEHVLNDTPNALSDEVIRKLKKQSKR
ncbi:hypothetical protein [Paenibacillus graminis]|uniref:hypothetical protein n=1 Tax=Paenibacillus graminis TaxID=189425 RepID=UPI002DB6B3A6|nr:hypothetical protein [Paenibacillus graminis]MEC0167874.1 hypothetical protein [Paenibacillus graminis]